MSRALEVYKICVYELKKQSKAIRVLLGYLVGAVIIVNQARDFLLYAEGKEAINVLETFIVVGNDYWTAMYLVLGWLLIISESPLARNDSLYVIYRTNRKNWNLAMIIYIIVQAICYYGTMILITVILGFGNGYFSNEWSTPLIKLTESASAGRRYNVTFPYGTFVKEVTVFEGFLHTVLLYILYGIILGLFLYTVTLVSNQIVGAIATFTLHFLGYETLAEGFMIIIKYSLLARSIPVLQIGTDLKVGISHSYFVFAMIMAVMIYISHKIIQVNVTFEKGKIYGIVGKNGSGKTILFKTIVGLVKPTSGKVYVNGKEIGKDVDFAEDVGLIIETPGFLFQYSANKNLEYLASIKNKITKEQIKKSIEMVGLDAESSKKVGKFSMGMRQRLGVAQAIMENPSLIILDEPMNGLDKNGIEIVKNLLISLKQEGKTILMASHYAEDTEVCDEIYEMDEGKIVKHG